MKIKKIICIAALTLCITPVFAGQKVKNPGKNQVILVGKVNVTTSATNEFIAESRSVKTPVAKGKKNTIENGVYAKPAKLTAKHTYKMNNWDNSKKAAKKFASGQTVTLDQETYFVLVYDVPENHVIDFDTTVEYKFFNSDYAKIELPFDLSIAVPYGETALYIGEFSYTLEDTTFAVKEVNHTSVKGDIYETFEKLYKNKYQLNEVPVYTLGEAPVPEIPVVEEVKQENLTVSEKISVSQENTESEVTEEASEKSE